jgi:hypothetical protein
LRYDLSATSVFFAGVPSSIVSFAYAGATSSFSSGVNLTPHW